MSHVAQWTRSMHLTEGSVIGKGAFEKITLLTVRNSFINLIAETEKRFSLFFRVVM